MQQTAAMLMDAFEPEGDAAWAMDGRSVVVAALTGGTPRLVRVELDTGRTTDLAAEYSIDPVWSPDGGTIVYSGADVGTTCPLKAMTADTFADGNAVHIYRIDGGGRCGLTS